MKNSAMDGGAVIKKDGSAVISVLSRSKSPVDISSVLECICEFECYEEDSSFYHVVTESRYLADAVASIYKKVCSEE